MLERPLRIALALIAIAVVAAPPRSHAQLADDDSTPAWAALARGGQVVMFRHSITDTGTGESPTYTFGNCATQRQLNAEGRAKAGRIGEAFAKRGVTVDVVLSSAWCRCRDTAQLAFGRHEIWTSLNVQNAQFNPATDIERQNAAVIDRIAKWRGKGNLVLSTHQLNISNLVQQFPAEGDGVVLRYDIAERRVIVVGPLRIP